MGQTVSLSLSLSNGLSSTQHASFSWIIVRDAITSVANFARGSRNFGRRIFFSPSHLLSGEYFRAGNPFKERYFPSDLFFTGVSRPFFNLPPSRQSVISSLSIEGKRFFYLESVSSPSFLPPRLTLTPMEIIPSPLFFHENSFQAIPIPYTRISRRVEQQSCRN